jgi:amino-acid N-acetyltransferase
MTIDKSLIFRLQSATVHDLPLIQRCLEQNHLPSIDIPSVLDKLFLAHLASEVVGIGGVETYGKYGLLRSLVIAKAFRGKGYGRVLCQLLTEQARMQGVQELYLLTTTADLFFEAFGFERVDRQTAPDVLQQTSEFSQLCPASAVCMKFCF